MHLLALIQPRKCFWFLMFWVLISRTSAEVFANIEVFGVFGVFARFGGVFANGGKVFGVFARKRNGLGGIFSETITFPYGNNPNLGLGCFRKET